MSCWICNLGGLQDHDHNHGCPVHVLRQSFASLTGTAASVSVPYFLLSGKKSPLCPLLGEHSEYSMYFKKVHRQMSGNTGLSSFTLHCICVPPIHADQSKWQYRTLLLFSIRFKQVARCLSTPLRFLSDKPLLGCPCHWLIVYHHFMRNSAATPVERLQPSIYVPVGPAHKHQTHAKNYTAYSDDRLR